MTVPGSGYSGGGSIAIDRESVFSGGESVEDIWVSSEAGIYSPEDGGVSGDKVWCTAGRGIRPLEEILLSDWFIAPASAPSAAVGTRTWGAPPCLLWVLPCVPPSPRPRFLAPFVSPGAPFCVLSSTPAAALSSSSAPRRPLGVVGWRAGLPCPRAGGARTTEAASVASAGVARPGAEGTRARALPLVFVETRLLAAFTRRPPLSSTYGAEHTAARAVKSLS